MDRASAAAASGLALLRRAFADQVAIARLFLRDDRLRAPALAIWVASFGGALHEPVTTFFTMALGATTAQMGMFGVIRSVGTWILGPFYGWLVDKYTAFVPTLISSFVCALGCTLRGFTPVGRIDLLYASAVILGLGAANFWNVVGTHLACATERELRPLVVSAFFVQVNTLELLGKLAYPLWDAALVATWPGEDKLLRFRVTMSVCSFFCIFGVFNLLWNGHAMKEVKCEDVEASPAEASSQAACEATTHDVAETVADEVRQRHPSVKHMPAGKAEALSASCCSAADVVTLTAIATVLVLQAAGVCAVKVLWPLYTRLQFSWEDREYAWLSLAGSLAAILAVCAMPAFAQRLGAPAVATTLCGMASLGVVVGFPAQASAGPHLAGALLFLASTAALRPCLEALASLAVAARLQGRVFAVLKLSDAAGQMLGNWAGTRLYDVSVADAPPQSVWLAGAWPLGTSGGALPFVVVGVTLFVSTSTLAMALLPNAAGRGDPAEAAVAASAANGGQVVSEGDRAAKTAEAETELANLLHQRARATRSNLAE